MNDSGRVEAASIRQGCDQPLTVTRAAVADLRRWPPCCLVISTVSSDGPSYHRKIGVQLGAKVPRAFLILVVSVRYRRWAADAEYGLRAGSLVGSGATPFLGPNMEKCTLDHFLGLNSPAACANLAPVAVSAAPRCQVAKRARRRNSLRGRVFLLPFGGGRDSRQTATNADFH
jgi:hypothetical protein